MTANAIPLALDVIRAYLQLQLDSLVANRVFWQLAPEQAELPLIVAHSADAGGAPAPHIGLVGWSGDIAVRVFASTRPAAEALASAMLAPIGVYASVQGHTLTWSLLRPVVIPPDNQRFVAGWIFNVQVYTQ